MRECQPTSCSLIHRYREQARSHRDSVVFKLQWLAYQPLRKCGITFSPIFFKVSNCAHCVNITPKWPNTDIYLDANGDIDLSEGSGTDSDRLKQCVTDTATP